jgi:predicted CxxxxCH...CXXCH cytochrome family protein
LPAASQSVGVHPDGWASPASSSFHGITIKDDGWSMATCKTCHGNDYKGGTTGVSCYTCHTGNAGPENCSTCHGSSTSPAPPQDLSGNTVNTARGVGAHQVHLVGTTYSKPATCAECHSIPGSVSTAGHIDGDNRAEVMMTNYLANLTTGGGSVVPSPSYNYTTFACSNTYCHGTFKNGNAANAPTWNDPSAAACGTCHGNPNAATTAEKALPGGTHESVSTACYVCHGGVVDASMKFVDASKHIDGKLNLFGSDQSF